MSKRGRRQQPEQNESAAMVLSSRGMSQAEVIQQVDTSLQKRTQDLLALTGHNEAIVEQLRAITLHALAEPRLARDLANADLASVFIAVREAAMAGLMPTGVNGEGYLVAYYSNAKQMNEIKFMPGYKGLQKLLADTAEIATGVVYESDRFEYELGSVEYVRHVPALKDRGDRLAVWADATMLATGHHRVEIMTIAEVEQRRKASKMSDRGAWVDWYDPMARKTVMRAICNRIPVSDRLAALLASESQAEERAALPPPEAEAPALITSGSSATDRARRMLGYANGPEQESVGAPAPEAMGPTGSGAGEPIPVGPPPDQAGEVVEPPRGESASRQPDAGEGVDSSSPSPAPHADGAESPSPAAVCGATPPADPDPLGLSAGGGCTRAPGHRGKVHENEVGTWS